MYDNAEELKFIYPGTTIMLRTFKNTIFSKEMFMDIYVCLGALKSKWLEGCRKIIDFDSTFLKGVYKGELLS